MGDVPEEPKSIPEVQSLTTAPEETPLPTTSSPPVPPSPLASELPPQHEELAQQSLEKPSIDIPQLESQVHILINSERKKDGLKPLKWNEEVAEVARKHSQYQAELNPGLIRDLYIDHMDKNGTYQDTRLKNGGVYYFFASGENIHASSIVKEYYVSGSKPSAYNTQDELAENAVTGWMNSPGHKDNILTPNYDEAGIGIARDPTATNYVFTQVFIQRSECGYESGACCQEPGGYPYCYVPLKCIDAVCEGHPNGTELIGPIEERDFVIISFFDKKNGQILEGDVYIDYEYYGKTANGDIRVYFRDIPSKKQLSPYIAPRVTIGLKGYKGSNPFNVKWQVTKAQLMESDATMIID